MSDLRPEHEITAREAHALLAGADPSLVLDCRLPEEHEIARIEGSLLVPLHEIEQRLDEIEDALEDRGLGRDAAFAVVCHHGVRSLRAALMLQQHGFAGARSVRGGIDAWSVEVDPGVARYERDGSGCRLI